MNITKKYKKLKKYNKKTYKNIKKNFKKNTRKKIKKKKKYTKKYKNFRNKKRLIQKGGDSFTNAVNIAQTVGAGVNLVDLAGSVTAGITEKVVERQVAVNPTVEVEEGEAAESPQGEEETQSLVTFCDVLASGAGEAAVAGIKFGGLATGIAFGAPLVSQANELFTRKSVQDKSVGNYGSDSSASNASKGAANDAANNTTKDAKAKYKQQQSEGS